MKNAILLVLLLAGWSGVIQAQSVCDIKGLAERLNGTDSLLRRADTLVDGIIYKKRQLQGMTANEPGFKSCFDSIIVIYKRADTLIDAANHIFSNPDILFEWKSDTAISGAFRDYCKVLAFMKSNFRRIVDSPSLKVRAAYQIREAYIEDYLKSRLQAINSRQQILTAITTCRINNSAIRIEEEGMRLERLLVDVKRMEDELEEGEDRIVRREGIHYSRAMRRARSYYDNLQESADSIIDILNRKSYLERWSNLLSLTVNNSFGVGYAHLADSCLIYGGDLFFHFKRANEDFDTIINKNCIGMQAFAGLLYHEFAVMPGIATPDFMRFSWSIHLLYHYKYLGVGFMYSPLFGSGIKLSYWLKGK